MQQVKILLDESDIPEHWYNVVADMPNPPAPPLGPDAKPIGPEALAAIFPGAIIEQEVSRERWIPVPEAVRAGSLAELAHAVAELPRLELRGLMCLPPALPDESAQRALFAQLRRHLEELNSQGLELDTLSMGMSADFQAAIAEGATHVRIGTALFGSR